MSRTQSREVYGFGAGVRTRTRSSVWSRWVIGAACLVLVVVTLTACRMQPDNDRPGGSNSPNVDGYTLTTYTDAATGCEYLRPTGQGGISPRVAADGKSHMGCKGTAP